MTFPKAPASGLVPAQRPPSAHPHEPCLAPGGSREATPPPPTPRASPSSRKDRPSGMFGCRVRTNRKVSGSGRTEGGGFHPIPTGGQGAGWGCTGRTGGPGQGELGGPRTQEESSRGSGTATMTLDRPAWVGGGGARIRVRVRVRPRKMSLRRPGVPTRAGGPEFCPKDWGFCSLSTTDPASTLDANRTLYCGHRPTRERTCPDPGAQLGQSPDQPCPGDTSVFLAPCCDH